MKKRTIWTLVFAVGLVIVTAVAAGAGRRHVDEFVEGADDLKPDEARVELDQTYTAEEKAEAERLGALEAEFTAQNRPGALHSKAEAGDGPSADGLALDSALNAASDSRLSGMRVVDVQSETVDGVVWEQVMFSDGSHTGYVMIWWQTLLGNEPTDAFVGEFGTVRDDGPVDVIIDERESDKDFRLIRVYDGSKILSVLSNDIAGVEADELIAIAKSVFEQLP